MCFVAAFADASETIDGTAVILRRQGEETVVNSLNGGPMISRRIEQAMGGLSMDKTLRFSFMASATVLLLGMSGGAQAQQVPQAPNMSFFVTSTPIGRFWCSPLKYPSCRGQTRWFSGMPCRSWAYSP